MLSLPFNSAAVPQYESCELKPGRKFVLLCGRINEKWPRLRGTSAPVGRFTSLEAFLKVARKLKAGGRLPSPSPLWVLYFLFPKASGAIA